jgi:hypothetical protein
MALVQLPMQGLQPAEQDHVSRSGPLLPGGAVRRWDVGAHRESQKLPLGGPAERTSDPGVEEPYNRLQDRIGSKPVATMDAESPSMQAQHHRAVGMGEDPFHIPETQCPKAVRQTILEEEALLGRHKP